MRTFYHGTSTALGVQAMPLPPDQTGVLREDWRKSRQDTVFLTASYSAARRYAKKAAEKFGGNPAICVVDFVSSPWYAGNGDWCCNRALIRKADAL